MSVTAPLRAFSGRALSFDIADEILEVRLHHEPSNEIGTLMLGELERVAAATRIDGIRAMLISSEVRRGFCAGADLREFYRELKARPAPSAARSYLEWADRRAPRVASRWARDAVTRWATRDIRAFLDRIHGVMNALDEAPFPTVGAVHGVCFGGGFELALTCDLLVADRTARFCFPELRLGLIPGFGGIPRLRRDVANSVIRDLLLSGRSLGAARAHELGLVSQLVAPGEHHRVARRLAEQAARFEPHVSHAAKRFAKPIPRAELEREKRIFCELCTSPVLEAALARFDRDEGPMPYLPAAR